MGGQLRTAYDETVRVSSLVEPVDKALIEAGAAIADQIDKVLADPDAAAQDVTKTLYLMPHLTNVLKEMLATPAARHDAKITGENAAKGKLATLRSIRTETA